MALNTPRPLQIYDPVLTQVARRYVSQGFIANLLLPNIPVSKLSGQYPVFTKRFWFAQLTDNEVTDRAPSREVDFEWSMDTYLAKEYALKVSITDLERQQADAALRLEMNKTELLTLQMDLAHEVRTANILLPTSLGGGLNNSHTPSILWDASNPTIEADIKTAAVDVYTKTGRVPNVIVIPYLVAYTIALDPTVRALLRYDATGHAQDFIQVGDRVLPSVIHGMQVIIPQGAQLDSAAEGSAADSISEIWGKHVRCLYVDPSAGWGIPSVAYKLNHTARAVTRWRIVDPDVDYIREKERYALKVVAPDAAHVITGAVS